jgi:hypothetical protein
MISDEEARFFADCACDCTGEGRIVDLGCWMGSTAVALAEGVHRAGRDERVEAFDIFIWEPWMDRSHARIVHGIYLQGESFLPEARRIIEQHGRGLVDLKWADLTAYEWSGGPLKLLLVDAMKTVALTRQIAATFYPSLRRDALVLHQDFKHFSTPWIHILQARLRPHFRFIHSVERGGTVGLRVVEPMSREQIQAALNFERMTEAETDACFEYSQSLLRPCEREQVAASHATYYCRTERPEKARRLVEHYARQGLDISSGSPHIVRAMREPLAPAA